MLISAPIKNSKMFVFKAEGKLALAAQIRKGCTGDWLKLNG